MNPNWKPAALCVALALAACGGGGDNGAASATALQAESPALPDAAAGGDADSNADSNADDGTGEGRAQTLATAAASCAALVSRSYVALDFSRDSDAAIYTLKIDASTLKITFSDTSTLQLKALGGCAFSASTTDGSIKIYVAKSGIATARFTEKSGAFAGKTFASVFVPKQTVALADLAGSWNMLQYASKTDTTYGAVASTFTLDSLGKFSAGSDCSGASTSCAKWDATPTALKAVTTGAGGFKFVDGSGATDRVFAFKASDGSLSLLVMFGDDGGFAVASKRAAIGLPTVGTSTKLWDFSVANTGYAGSVSEFTSKILTVDSANGKYTRSRSSDGRVDTFYSDAPRKGLRYRKTNGCKLNGAATSCAGVLVMPLPGTGVSFYFGLAPADFFGVSIQKP